MAGARSSACSRRETSPRSTSTRSGLRKAPPAGTANANFGGLSDTMFQGVVGVTPALRLDNHLWPRRGALGHVFNRSVPSPDEALLYPWHVEYAQNGRFAVGTHTGVGRPQSITVPLPDWTTLPVENALFPLTLLGFTVSVDLDLRNRSRRHRRECRGELHIPPWRRGSVDHPRRGPHQRLRCQRHNLRLPDRPAPIARGLPQIRSVTGRPMPAATCRAVKKRRSPTSSTIEPGVGATPVQFTRPRGATIQPFVYFEAPRFGDHLTRTQPIFVGWRDARVRELRFQVLHLGTAAAPIPPVVVGGLTVAARHRRAR